MVKLLLQIVLMGFGLLATIGGVLIAVAGAGMPHGDVGSIIGPFALLAGFAIGTVGVSVGAAGLGWYLADAKKPGPPPRKH